MSEEEEMLKQMWEEDGPPTLEDENLYLIWDGEIKLIGRGGIEQHFKPDPELDAALVEILDAYDRR